jgi:TolA-binding protein
LREAEFNFKDLSQKLPSSPLAFEARMMAGKLALDRKDYAEARESFTNLTSNPNCPRNLKIQATFAYGSVIMQQAPGGTNELANFQRAIAVFTTIHQDYPDTEHAALAWGEIAKCNRQLASQGENFYTNAMAAYQQVVNSPHANIAARSEAKVGLGMVAEALAEKRSGEARIALLKWARDEYLDVFYEKILRDGELPQLFWVKQAGLNAARVVELAAESVEDWEQARKVYQDLQKLLPPLSASLDKKIDRVRERLASRAN